MTECWCMGGWGPPGCPTHDPPRKKWVGSPICNCGRLGGEHSYTPLLCPELS